MCCFSHMNEYKINEKYPSLFCMHDALWVGKNPINSILTSKPYAIICYERSSACGPDSGKSNGVNNFFQYYCKCPEAGHAKLSLREQTKKNPQFFSAFPRFPTRGHQTKLGGSKLSACVRSGPNGSLQTKARFEVATFNFPRSSLLLSSASCGRGNCSAGIPGSIALIYGLK